MKPIMTPDSTTTGYPKSGFPEKVGTISGDDPQRGENEYVDLGMAEHPKEVLP